MKNFKNRKTIGRGKEVWKKPTTSHTPGETPAPLADLADLAPTSVQVQTLALSLYYSCEFLFTIALQMDDLETHYRLKAILFHWFGIKARSFAKRATAFWLSFKQGALCSPVVLFTLCLIIMIALLRLPIPH